MYMYIILYYIILYYIILLLFYFDLHQYAAPNEDLLD